MKKDKALEALGYQMNHRTFAQVQKLFSEEHRQCTFSYKPHDVVYSGAEHRGNPKLPNLTFLPHLLAGEGIILGSTFGHTHTGELSRRFQEIYEFCGYGGMLLYQPSRPEENMDLYFLRPGEKMGVGPDQNMTLYNFGSAELLTLDYADPSRNTANKDLEGRLGALLMIEYFEGDSRINLNQGELIFRINEKYLTEGILPSCEEKKVVFSSFGLGEEAYCFLGSGEAEKLRALGIRSHLGGNIPELAGHLAELALQQDPLLLSLLGLPP